MNILIIFICGAEQGEWVDKENHILWVIVRVI